MDPYYKRRPLTPISILILMRSILLITRNTNISDPTVWMIGPQNLDGKTSCYVYVILRARNPSFDMDSTVGLLANRMVVMISVIH